MASTHNPKRNLTILSNIYQLYLLLSMQNGHPDDKKNYYCHFHGYKYQIHDNIIVIQLLKHLLILFVNLYVIIMMRLIHMLFSG